MTMFRFLKPYLKQEVITTTKVSIRPEIRELVAHISDLNNCWKKQHDKLFIYGDNVRWTWEDIEIALILPYHSLESRRIYFNKPSGPLTLTPEEKDAIKDAFGARDYWERKARERQQLDDLHQRLNKNVALQN